MKFLDALAFDLVVGDSVSKAYGFIEFEDAAPNCIFIQRPGKATPEWDQLVARLAEQLRRFPFTAKEE